MQSLRYLFLLVLIGTCHSGSTQNRDSLLRAYHEAPTAELRLAIASTLCVNYLNSGQDSTAFFCQEAKSLALTLNRTTEAIQTMLDLGFLYHRKSQYRKALQEYHQALWLSQTHQSLSLQAETHNNIAIAHQRMARLDSAYSHWSQAERLYKQLGSPAEMWRVYSGLFALFRDKGDTAQANQYAALAYEKAAEGASRADRGYIIFQLLQYYFQTEQFEQLAKFQQHWDAYKLEKKEFEAINPSISPLKSKPFFVRLWVYKTFIVSVSYIPFVDVYVCKYFQPHHGTL